MRKEQKLVEKTLKQKLTNLLSGLAISFGILSPLSMEFPFFLWIAILTLKVVLVLLFHVLTILKIRTKQVLQYFLKLEKDIEFIKKKLIEK